ncbi:hypothetical protein QAD02_000377 [Eretmocerus hayati]|uniref:Uncharacterized protein n=1 Tax=Eretmocerus hayati TaxID=131215 RepID=A0ACC2NDV4_9HYME|nr:hypothetical protein QAD02_000377 [Eretmocerus hayati]
MRIVEAFGALVAVVWLTAVLCTRLVAANNQTLNFSSRKPKDHHLSDQFSHRSMLEDSTSSSRQLTIYEMQELIRWENNKTNLMVDCCPTVEEITEPQGGRNQGGMYVELYRDGDLAQRFFEHSCRDDVLDKPCRFVHPKLHGQSRCVQKFSFTYALVKNPAFKPDGTEEEQPQHQHHRHHHSRHQTFPSLSGSAGAATNSWTLDYIKVRSGCSCELAPKKGKLAAMKVKRTRSVRTHHLTESSAETDV